MTIIFFILSTLLCLEMIKPAKIMIPYNLQSCFLLTFQWLHKRCKHAHFLLHRVISWMLLYGCTNEFQINAFTGFSESMCGQPIYLVRVVWTVMDFFPCLVFSSQKPRCLSNEAQPHSGLLQPSRWGEIWLVEGRDSWRKSTERFLDPNYSNWKFQIHTLGC